MRGGQAARHASGNLQCPASMMFGRSRAAHESWEEAFGHDLQDAELALPDAGHFVLEETKGVVASLILKFSVEHLSDRPMAMGLRGPSGCPLLDISIQRLTVTNPPRPPRRFPTHVGRRSAIGDCLGTSRNTRMRRRAVAVSLSLPRRQDRLPCGSHPICSNHSSGPAVLGALRIVRARSRFRVHAGRSSATAVGG
jgi:hypothetical protein